MLVYTTGAGVYGFTLDPTHGSFILSHPRIKIPSKGAIYSINESYFEYWDDGIKNYIQWAKRDGTMTSRYIGSLVSDFHRNLLKGGIYLYPGDNKKPENKNGKLRLLYEANPLAFIAAQAGGVSTGHERILCSLRNSTKGTPLIIGSKEDVDIAETCPGQKNVLKDYGLTL